MSTNTGRRPSARGCHVCSTMNLAAVGVGAGMQFPGAAGIWGYGSKPPFPSSEDGHPCTPIGISREQRRGAQQVDRTSTVPGYPWEGPRLTGARNERDDPLCGFFASFSRWVLFSGHAAEQQGSPAGPSSLLSSPTAWAFRSGDATFSGSSHLRSFDQDRVTSPSLLGGWETTSKHFGFARSLSQNLSCWTGVDTICKMMAGTCTCFTQPQSCFLCSESVLAMAGHRTSLAVHPLPVFNDRIYIWLQWYQKLGACFLVKTRHTGAPLWPRCFLVN